MVSSPRAALLATQRAADDDIDREIAAPLARAVAASVRRHTTGQERLSVFARARVLIDADEALRGPYGAFRGDTRAALYRIVAARSREAALAALDAAVRGVRRRVGEAAWRVIEEAAG